MHESINRCSLWQSGQRIRAKPELGAGIDSYVFGRCAPGPDPTHFFWWEGLDGSRVLGYVPAGWYNVSLRDGTRQILDAARKNTDLRDFMLLYGAGDHGGGPRDVDLAAIRKFRDDANEPRLIFDLPETYLKGIAGEMSGSTSAPTQTQRDSCAIAEGEFKPVYEELKRILAEDVKAIEKRLDAVGAPYTPGRLPDWK